MASIQETECLVAETTAADDDLDGDTMDDMRITLYSESLEFLDFSSDLALFMI